MAPKRKRAGTLSKDDHAPEAEGAEQQQPVVADGEAAAAAAEEESDKPAKRTRASSKATASNGTVNEAGEHGEAGKMRMAPPPKAGAVDPQGGYKTNKPPTGRPVSVYADGVFDLFQLGYVFPGEGFMA